MEIQFDEMKCLERNIDIYGCYNIIDSFFHEQGVIILAQGMYSGKYRRDKGFKPFALAICKLPQVLGFLECLKCWKWYTNDCVKDYLLIFKKRTQNVKNGNYEKF